MSKKVLRVGAVLEKTGLGISTLKVMVKSKTFPQPIQIGPSRAQGWLESEIDGWIDERVADRDAVEGGAE
jgi:prophage regulatory protein